VFTTLFGEMVNHEAYLSVGLFYYMPLLLMLFSLQQVWGWASDEEEGRLELLLSQPLPRRRVVLARFAVAALGLAVIVALTIAGTLITARLVDLELDGWRVAGATLAAAPLALVVLAFGLALATWLARPGPAVVITTALMVAMFFVTSLAPLFDWPVELRRLSVFHYYGRPVIDGVSWSDMLLMLAVALLLGLASLAGFQRRDIVK
jgi:ABC-2 type transport system permease protein